MINIQKLNGHHSTFEANISCLDCMLGEECEEERSWLPIDSGRPSLELILLPLWEPPSLSSDNASSFFIAWGELVPVRLTISKLILTAKEWGYYAQLQQDITRNATSGSVWFLDWYSAIFLAVKGVSSVIGFHYLLSYFCEFGCQTWNECRSGHYMPIYIFKSIFYVKGIANGMTLSPSSSKGFQASKSAEIQGRN